MAVTVDPSALVVRGGAVRDAQLVLEKIMDAVADGDGPVLSVYCTEPVPGLTLMETVYKLCVESDLPHAKVQLAVAECLLAAGVGLVQWTAQGEPACHYHANFGDDVDASVVQRFIDCFSEPMPNPTGGVKRRDRGQGTS